MTPRSKQPEIDDSNDYGGRIPPQDIDAERSLLGAILIDSNVFPEILESVKSYDFYDKRHCAIYSAMTTLVIFMAIDFLTGFDDGCHRVISLYLLIIKVEFLWIVE